MEIQIDWPNHRQKLISDLFAKIQSLEDKLEVARDTANAPTISSTQNTQPASFAASGTLSSFY
jgi:hypothetical protein